MRIYDTDGIGELQTLMGDRHEHDDLVMADAFTLVGQVSNRTSSVTWTDLDISSYIPSGSKAALLRLRIHIDSYTDGVVSLAVRENGNSYEAMKLFARTDTPSGNDVYMSGWCGVDINRYIEYEISITGTAQADFYIDLMGYATNIANVTLDTSGALMADGSVPLSGNLTVDDGVTVDGRDISAAGARVYPSSTFSVPTNNWTKILLNTEDYDILGEFDNYTNSGVADGTEANKLHDADGGFSVADVGHWVYNSTDKTYTQITGFVDSGELDLADDIFVSGESYTVYHARFTATVADYYTANANNAFNTVGDGKIVICQIRKNGSGIAIGRTTSGGSAHCGQSAGVSIYLDVGDYVELFGYHDHGSSRQLIVSEGYTQLSILRG